MRRMFRVKVRILGRRYGFLPGWTQAEVDDIMARAKQRAEELAKYVG